MRLRGLGRGFTNEQVAGHPGAWHSLCTLSSCAWRTLPVVACGVRTTRGSRDMPKATLSISSKNYSSWSLRGWLLARVVILEFEEVLVSQDADARSELMLISPSILVTGLSHCGIKLVYALAV